MADAEKFIHESKVSETTSLLLNQSLTETTGVGGTERSIVLQRIFPRAGLTISFSNICVVRKAWWRWRRLCLKPGLAVQSASGLFTPGHIHGIVDLTGESSPELIAVLAGSALAHTGTVAAEGIPVATDNFRRSVGVINPHLNLSMPNLSAMENVQFALKMRAQLPTALETASRVSSALSLMMLDPTQKVRAMTPAELVRLQFAMELALDCPVLFGVNPLGPLDSHEVHELMACLADVAATLRKTLVLSLRSLPFNVFDTLDQVVLLGLGGRCLYSGPSGEMLRYFNQLRLPASLYASPMLDELGSSARRMGETTRSSFNEDALSIPSAARLCHASLVASKAAVAAHVRLEIGERVEIDGASRGRTPTPPPDQEPEPSYRPSANQWVVDSGDGVLDVVRFWAESEEITIHFAAVFYDSLSRSQLLERQAAFSDGCHGVTSPSLASRYFGAARGQQRGTSAPYRIYFLCKTYFLETVRQVEFYLVWALLNLVLATLSWLLSTQGQDQMGMMNVRGVIFMLLFLALLANIVSVHATYGDINVFLQHREGGYYGTPTYVVVWLLRLVLTRVVYLACFVPFVVYFLDISRDFVSLVFATSIAHAFSVYAVAVVSPSARVASVLSVLYVGYAAVFSGFLINLTSLPSWVGYLSVLRFGYAAAVRSELLGRPYSCDSGNSTAFQNITSYCYTGDQYLALEGFTRDSLSWSLNVLYGAAAAIFLCCSIVFSMIR
jgi:ABC-type multidrug transport system ATPase subunit